MKVLQLREKCTGCYACVNVCPNQCIRMLTDAQGFWYPEIDSALCIQCGLCEKRCPALSGREITNQEIVAYAARNQNEEIRMQSSSGGVFTLLAEEIIAAGGVVFGAAMTEDCRAVEHIAVGRSEDIARLRGSKYLQSRIGDTYQLAKKHLQSGRKVLFSGTPCQIEGLRRYLHRDYDNLLCVDIICHGVPSPKVWERYVSYCETVAEAQAKQVSFREKSDSWKQYSVHIDFSNGGKYQRIFKDDLYMKAFLSNACLRPSCAQCTFKKLNRVSDITLADFWGIEMVAPEMDDDKGTSLVLVHSQKGERAFSCIQENLHVKEVDVEAAIQYNPSAKSASVPHEKRAEFFSHLDSMPFDKLVRRYTAPKLSAKERIGVMLQKIGLLNFVQHIRRRA